MANVHAGGEPERPWIVCLCGSTRFYQEYQQAYFAETLAGRIVLSVGFYPHASREVHGQHIGITPAQKGMLDDLHRRKIDLADEIFVLDIGGYIGESTRSEIAYAEAHGKRLRYWSQSQLDNPPTPTLTVRAGQATAGLYAADITSAKATLRQVLMQHGLTGATIALMTVRHAEVHAALTAYQLALREAYDAQMARHREALSAGAESTGASLSTTAP